MDIQLLHWYDSNIPAKILPIDIHPDDVKVVCYSSERELLLEKQGILFIPTNVSISRLIQFCKKLKNLKLVILTTEDKIVFKNVIVENSLSILDSIKAHGYKIF